MRKLVAIVVLVLAAGLWAQGAAPEEGRTRFCAVEIYLDPKGTPLAAYQLEFTVTNATAKIVGIEGGGHAAFREPPFYDPKAMQNDRVILGAFSTAKASEVPNARTRVARVHLQLSGTNSPQYELKVQAAADSEGKRILVEAEVKQEIEAGRIRQEN